MLLAEDVGVGRAVRMGSNMPGATLGSRVLSWMHSTPELCSLCAVQFHVALSVSHTDGCPSPLVQGMARYQPIELRICAVWFGKP